MRQSLPGLKISKNSLIVPLENEADALTSLQFISPQGEKLFYRDGQTGGSFFTIANKDEKPESSLIVCEGLATGLSLWECTGDPVFVAFNACNLLPVAEVARRKFPDRKIVIAADNDVADGKSNTGLEAATKAAEAVGALLAVPSLKSGGKCDWNDLHVAEGRDEVFQQYGKAEKVAPPQPQKCL
jgi:putative DNA primase/helicase